MQLSFVITDIVSIILLLRGGCATILCDSGAAVYYFTHVEREGSRAYHLLYYCCQAAAQIFVIITGVLSVTLLLSGDGATTLRDYGRIYYFTDVERLCSCTAESRQVLCSSTALKQL